MSIPTKCSVQRALRAADSDGCVPHGYASNMPRRCSRAREQSPLYQQQRRIQRSRKFREFVAEALRHQDLDYAHFEATRCGHRFKPR